MATNSSSIVETNLCTQEEEDVTIPPSTAPVPLLDVSVSATLHRFSSYSNDIQAKLVCAAAELEKSKNTPMYHSPDRRRLMGELQHIDVLTTQLQKPALKIELGELAAGKYIASKQTALTKPPQPRALFPRQQDFVTKKDPLQIEVDEQHIPRQHVPQQVFKEIPSQKKLSSKRKRRTSITWKNVQKQVINTSSSIDIAEEYLSDYLRTNFPSFLKRSVDKSNDMIRYECKLSTKPNDWGLCKIKTKFLHSPSTKPSIDVQIQVVVTKECTCNSSGKKVRGLSKRTFKTINTLVLTEQNLQPHEASLKIIQNEMNSTHGNRTLFPVTTNKERIEAGKQIKNNIHYQQRCARRKGLLAHDCSLVGDIVRLKEQHSFSITDKPIKSSPSEPDIKEWGTQLYKSGQLKIFETKSITNYESNAYLCMTILDPLPSSNDTGVTNREKALLEYIQQCVDKKQPQVKVEGSTFHTTVVFTSLGLLYNASQCSDLGWQLMCSCDGTDHIFSNDYQLLTLGTFNLNKKGVKSFRPFFYVMCLGERQESFGLGCLAFLKYCRLLFNITDIDFVGGAASDCTEVFTNIYHIAFPSTKKVQCHVHIERKFWKGKGNGGYLHYAIDKSYFYNTCRIDVNQLHHCLSQKQFDTYAKFVKEAWRAAVKDGKIESGLFRNFFSNYINNPTFAQWFVSCGGVCGYDPTSQPTERSMLMMKGTKKCKGLMSIGHNVGTMIQVEFPKFIVNVSTTLMGVESKTSLQEEDIILDTNSDCYKDLALYYNSITESIDTSSNFEDGKIEHLINTEEFVGMFVDNDRVTRYYEALNGVTNETFTSRQKFFDCVSSLCLVSGSTVDNKVVYTGSCVQY